MNHAGRSWGAAVGVQANTPHYTQQDVGGTVRMVDTNPFTNPGIASGDADASKTFTPAEASGQVTITRPDGTTYSLPRATVAGYQGQGGLVAPGASGGIFGSGRYGAGAPTPGMPGAATGSSGAPGGGGDPFGPAAMPPQGSDAWNASGGSTGASGGVVPPASGGSPPGITPGAPPASGLPAGAIQTGIGPAANASAVATGTANANAGSELFASAQGVPERKAMLSDMSADLATAPTGPGTQSQAYWSAFANRHIGSLAQLVPGIQSPDQVASFENFEKVSGRYMQNQAASLGPLTNDKLSSAALSNPNTMFSTLGNQGVISILQGNEDAIATKNNAWQQYRQQNGPAADYQTFSTNFNNSGFSPTAFWLKNMPQDQRSQYVNSLGPQDQQTLFQNVRTAIGKGWVSPSDFTPPSPTSGAVSAPTNAPPPSSTSAPTSTAVTPVVPTN